MTIAVRLATCSKVGSSPRAETANATANNGARLPSDPVTFGPIWRLDSKARSVTSAGKNNPTVANISTELLTQLSVST